MKFYSISAKRHTKLGYFPYFGYEHELLDGLESRIIDFIGKLPLNNIIILELGYRYGTKSLSFTGAGPFLEKFSCIGVVLVSRVPPFKNHYH